MRRVVFTLVLCLLATSYVMAQDNLMIWYEQPAQHWEEAMPLGNGKLGAMVFGRIDDELIQLNEGSLWSGIPMPESINPEAYQYLKQVREAIDMKDYSRANSLCQKMQGRYSQSFMPMADLQIHQTFANGRNGNSPRNYKRLLTLNDAIAEMNFQVDGVNYSRQTFVSAPDNVMAIRLLADKPAQLSIDIAINSQLIHQVTTTDTGLKLTGRAPSRVDPNYYNRNGREPIEQGNDPATFGMRVATLLDADVRGGEVKTDTDGLHVSNADEVVIYITAATSYDGPYKHPYTEGKDELKIATEALANARAKDFATLKQRHIDDFEPLFNRISLKINPGRENRVSEKMPTDLRLKVYSYGQDDPGIEELFFQYGRYLLISSSRPGGTPANLQGVWNPHYRAPWSSNFTININTQMNYWPAETTNLSEMHTPLIDWILSLEKNGTNTAKEFYHARGWVAHHNSDIWALTTPVGDLGYGDPTWANWYMGAAWLCQHLYEHYAFTGDKDYLAKVYPTMKNAALFCLDWLVEDKDEDGNTYLLTSPSTSPEHRFRHDGNTYSVNKGTTMDVAIIRELFTDVIKASEALDADKNLRKQIQEAKDRLLHFKIGRQQRLQEWYEDYDDVEVHHRHISHLFGLHPGSQISPITTPVLAKAADKTLEIRGDEGTGWSKAWKINFAARLLDGNHAYKMMRETMRFVNPANPRHGGTFPNLFDAHPPFQIDGNFGATAGVAEMLLQSRLAEIHILPALPDAWTDGKVEGLKARGNFTVGIEWKDGKMLKADITSVIGSKCAVRTDVPVTVLDTEAKTIQDEAGYYVTTFDTKPNTTYHLVKNI